MFALRGVPSDYARWADAGAANFSWEQVLPYFRRVENDSDRASNGVAPGPHAVSRTPRDQWPEFVRAMGQAAQRAGLPFVPDINEQPGDGFFSMPLAIDSEVRATSAGCYLTTQVRARANLQIMSNSLSRCLAASVFQRTCGTLQWLACVHRPVQLAARTAICPGSRLDA
jgi:5-(hydroxymethyl)furfural/furfural oxidase